jgi:predicted ester cyclase
MAGDPATILRRLYDEVINAGHLDVADELLDPDYVEHPEGVHGPGAFKARMQAFRQAFPDLQVTIDEVLVDGERASTRTTIRGTQTGDLMGIPATGRRVQILAVDLAHFRGGRAIERWGGLDMFSLMQQLGVVPAPAGAGS